MCLKAGKDDELQLKDSFFVAHNFQHIRTRRVIRITDYSSVTAVNTYLASHFCFPQVQFIQH